MNEYYWQDMMSGLVTKTTTTRKPSRLHKRITREAFYAGIKAAEQSMEPTVPSAGKVPQFTRIPREPKPRY